MSKFDKAKKALIIFDSLARSTGKFIDKFIDEIYEDALQIVQDCELAEKQLINSENQRNMLADKVKDLETTLVCNSENYCELADKVDELEKENEQLKENDEIGRALKNVVDNHGANIVIDAGQVEFLGEYISHTKSIPIKTMISMLKDREQLDKENE